MPFPSHRFGFSHFSHALPLFDRTTSAGVILLDSDAEDAPEPDLELVPADPAAEASGPVGFGELRLSIEPGDAAVYVDSDLRGIASEIGLLELSEGDHQIEIVRPGFRAIERDVRVRAGEVEELAAELAPD